MLIVTQRPDAEKNVGSDATPDFKTICPGFSEDKLISSQ